MNKPTPFARRVLLLAVLLHVLLIVGCPRPRYPVVLQNHTAEPLVYCWGSDMPGVDSEWSALIPPMSAVRVRPPAVAGADGYSWFAMPYVAQVRGTEGSLRASVVSTELPWVRGRAEPYLFGLTADSKPSGYRFIFGPDYVAHVLGPIHFEKPIRLARPPQEAESGRSPQKQSRLHPVLIQNQTSEEMIFDFESEDWNWSVPLTAMSSRIVHPPELPRHDPPLPWFDGDYAVSVRTQSGTMHSSFHSSQLPPDSMFGRLDRGLWKSRYRFVIGPDYTAPVLLPRSVTDVQWGKDCNASQ